MLQLYQLCEVLPTVLYQIFSRIIFTNRLFRRGTSRGPRDGQPCDYKFKLQHDEADLGPSVRRSKQDGEHFSPEGPDFTNMLELHKILSSTPTAAPQAVPVHQSVSYYQKWARKATCGSLRNNMQRLKLDLVFFTLRVKCPGAGYYKSCNNVNSGMTRWDDEVRRSKQDGEHFSREALGLHRHVRVTIKYLK